MSSKAQLVGALASLLVVGVGCAVGSAADTDVMEGTLASTPIEAGADEEESVKLPPPSNTEAPKDAGSTTDASSDAGKADSGGGGGGTTVACTASSPCTGATDLGAVSGDTSSSPLSAQGTGSQWFRVWVTENDNGVDGVKLRANATLTSPPGTNFDLYLYNGSSSAHECAGVSAQSNSSGSSDAAGVSFGEGGVLANGSNDSRYVTVEVRWVSGACASNQKWSLTFNGNQ